MKSVINFLILLFTLTFTTNSFAQGSGRGIPFSVFVTKPWPGAGVASYPGRDVDAAIQLKYDDGTLAYEEIFHKQLDNFSNLKVFIGEGEPAPGSDYSQVDWLRVSKYCYTIYIHDDQQVYTIMDEKMFGGYPYSNYAQTAGNANGLGGHPAITTWNNNVYDEFKNPESGGYLITTDDDNHHIMQPYYYSDIIQYHPGTSHVTGNPLDVFEPKILQHGSVLLTSAAGGTPGPVKNMVEICVKDLNEYLHGLGIIVKEATRNSTPHTTAAVYAENIADPLGIGVFANGGARGSLNQGQTGSLGSTVGEGNGAGLWGYVGAAPAAGGFKYAITGDNQGLANTYSAAVFGNGFYTGTWSMVSDARLKTGVRAQQNALEQISKLKPAQYNYISDSPYRLPDGIHYGFLAQEVEEVMPELVEDIILPRSLDPAEMTTSGAETYKAINYTEMIPLLTAALQELNQKVKALAAENESLKKELQACKPK